MTTTMTMVFGLSAGQALGIVSVAVCWGCTNPFLNRGGQQSLGKASSSPPSLVREVASLLTNWRFVLPFVLNQFGSALYAAVLASTDLSLVHPISNALAMVFTALTASCLGEQRLTARKIAGMGAISSGIAICILSRDA